MQTGQKIRVMLVDDSPIALQILERLLSDSPDIHIVGTARDGEQAIGLLPRLRPDVICTDYHMPHMDGLELIHRVMSSDPRPVLVVSVSVQDQGDEENIFTLLEAGALDVLPKPRGGSDPDYAYIKHELVKKIRVLSGVHVFRRHRLDPGLPHPSLSKEAERLMSSVPANVVAIGASTGGPPALQRILHALPADFPAPILCIQHISKGFLPGLVNWLQHGTALRIKIGEDGELARRGTVYLAPDDHHLLMDRHGRLHTPTSPDSTHKPSITETFSSLAASFGRQVIGILLTGMGDDGAAGLREIADNGGITIAQDEASCVVFGMPKVAIEIGAARFVLPLADIAPRVVDVMGEQSRRHSLRRTDESLS